MIRLSFSVIKSKWFNLSSPQRVNQTLSPLIYPLALRTAAIPPNRLLNPSAGQHSAQEFHYLAI